MNKLEDINYALMAQLSYLNWNRVARDKIDREILSEILFEENIISQIKTDFYNNPKNFPNTETISGKQGDLPAYTYHEEDKRLFLVYSIDEKNKDRNPLFGKILDGWEYLDCATGEIIEKRFFGEEILKEEKYKESGFFGVAFKRGNDIMIAYRGTEFELAFARDMETDFNIYMKKTDIQLNIT